MGCLEKKGAHLLHTTVPETHTFFLPANHENGPN
jgi:hypothetical protein